MRKLILCNFKAKTGDYELEDYRIVVVTHNEGETETDMLLKASKSFMNDFPSYFPESELLSVCPLPTWGEHHPSGYDEKKTFYSEARLIEFGEYLLDRVERDVRPYLIKADRPDQAVFKVNAVDLINWKERNKDTSASG